MLEFYSRILDRAEEGQTMAEYAVILGVITLAIVTALGVLSGAINTALGKVSGYV
jgi:Flp pilus assembly pilin Flp